MTIATTTNQVTYQGNNSTTNFSFNFPYVSAANIAVYLTNAGGLTTTLPTSSYTLALNPPAGGIWGLGGTVTYNPLSVPLAPGNYLTIARVLPYTQNTSISNQSAFYPQTVEAALDTICMELQQIATRTTQYRGVWVSGVSYNPGDIVLDGSNGNSTGNFYICLNANTSGVWGTDLAAGDWGISINVQQIISSMTPISAAMAPVTSATTLALARTAMGLGSAATENLSSVITDNGSGGLTIANNQVTNARLAQMAANTIKGNNTGSAANAADLTVAQVLAMLAIPVTNTVGKPTNLKVVYASATTATITMDEVTVKTALGGTPYFGSNLSHTLNVGTVGVNGMDTGSPAANTALHIYEIYNPTNQTWGVLATNAGNGATIYPGTHLPSGYTASNWISSICMNGSSQFTNFFQSGGQVSIVPVTIATGANAAYIPASAVYVNGLAKAGAGVTCTISDASNTLGTITIGSPGATAQQESPWTDIPMTTPSTLTISGSFSVMQLCGYTLWC